MNLLNGVNFTVTGPVKYKVTYFNGQFEYTEPFVILDFSKQIVDGYLQQADTWVHGVATFFAGAGNTGAAATLGISAAVCNTIAVIIEVGYGTLKNWVINSDGSVSLAVAYHYAGTRNAGIDLTATPIPGVDPNDWYAVVNQLLKYKHNRNFAEQLNFEDDIINVGKLEDFTFHASSPEGSKPEVLAEGWGSDFYTAFSQCMESKGLTVPQSLFATQEKALATINSLYSIVKTFGTSVTISELVLAGTLSEAFMVIGAVSAAYYVGVAIGCAINAGILASNLPFIFW